MGSKKSCVNLSAREKQKSDSHSGTTDFPHTDTIQHCTVGVYPMELFASFQAMAFTPWGLLRHFNMSGLSYNDAVPQGIIPIVRFLMKLDLHHWS